MDNIIDIMNNGLNITANDAIGTTKPLPLITADELQESCQQQILGNNHIAEQIINTARNKAYNNNRIKVNKMKKHEFQKYNAWQLKRKKRRTIGLNAFKCNEYRHDLQPKWDLQPIKPKEQIIGLPPPPDTNDIFFEIDDLIKILNKLPNNKSSGVSSYPL